MGNQACSGLVPKSENGTAQINGPNGSFGYPRLLKCLCPQCANGYCPNSFIEFSDEPTRVKDNSDPKGPGVKLIAKPNEVSCIMAINGGSGFDFNPHECSVTAFEKQIDFVFSILTQMMHRYRRPAEQELWTKLRNNERIHHPTK
jgi:hypothetical protein